MKKKLNGNGAIGSASLKKAFQQRQNAQSKAILAQQEEENRKKELREQQAREAAAAAEALRRKELEKNLHPVRERKLSTEKKSSAKAAGLKSTFILSDNELLMTAFGQGNEAIIEKKITDGRVENLNEKPAFTAVPEEKKAFRIDGRVKGAQTDNPLYTADASLRKPDDLIHAKAALEKRYFGQTFDSNLHIQAIYSILDIEKILAIHVNNIVYTLNNFLRQEGEDVDDFIGYVTSGEKTYQQFMESKDNNADELRALFTRLCSARQLRYLSLEIMKPRNPGDNTKEDENTIKLTEEEFYNILYAMGIMRQMLAHGDPYKNIYTLEGYGKNASVEKVLTRLYKERINQLNTDFLSKAGTNLTLLFKAFGITDVEKKGCLVRDYYDFTVRKQYKNLGFSIKLLREHMTADIEEAFILRDKAYDSVRGKLYPFIDFALFRYYHTHNEETNSLVNGLRASFNEVEKDGLYAREAARIWPKVRSVILEHILPEMSGEVIIEAKSNSDKDIKETMLSGAMISTEATDFSKFIYLTTLFINGKEINDLLTTLIHKFECIFSFLAVIQSQHLPSRFVDQFSVFSESDKIAQELRAINSFARMSRPSAKAKEIMYIEAFQVLGMRANSDQLEREAKELLDPKISGERSQKRGIRNFISKNVIASDRFKYLVRYGNVKKLKGIATNRAVVSFVLQDIPDSQIARYYNSVTGEDKDFQPAMRNFLADRLTGFSFEDISDVRQNDQRANQRQQEEKRQKQALVRLYLTVLYLTLKNLVYVNSRYFLAFHCMERDRRLLHPEKWEKIPREKQFDPEFGASVFARDFLAEYPRKTRQMTYLNQNFDNSDEWALRAFRNKAEHLDAVRNADLYLGDIREFHSWFELYHYIMQRRIMDQFTFDSTHKTRDKTRMIISEEELNPKTREYFHLIARYRVYCKDFVKALCVPFAYNLPRFKNLSIDGLFDKNRPGKEKDGEETLPED